MSERQQLTVPDEAAGQRLDQFLAAALQRTRGEVQRKIAAGEITVDDRRAAKDFRLVSGQVITLAPDAPPAPAEPMPEPRIVAEDDDVLVLDKPAGLTVHPAPGVKEPTLVDWLLRQRPNVAGVGEDPRRPGIVHRLDREASGLMVVAKTSAAFEFLQRAFQEHRVGKRYLALVHGLVAQDTGEIRFPIDRSERDGKMAAKPVGGAGREAITHYTVLERLPPFTLVEIRTETGRTHQVRVHFQAVGHPIAGDPLYGPRHAQTKKSPPRMFLHAGALTVPQPARDARTYEAPLPPDLDRYLTTIRHA